MALYGERNYDFIWLLLLGYPTTCPWLLSCPLGPGADFWLSPTISTGAEVLLRADGHVCLQHVSGMAFTAT